MSMLLAVILILKEKNSFMFSMHIVKRNRETHSLQEEKHIQLIH